MLDGCNEPVILAVVEWNEWILDGTEFVRQEDRYENKSPGLKRIAS